jgi:hypothetical protein
MIIVGQYCGLSESNPNGGIESFDNFGVAMLNVFQVVTQEGWTVCYHSYSTTQWWLVHRKVLFAAMTNPNNNDNKQ